MDETGNPSENARKISRRRLLSAAPAVAAAIGGGFLVHELSSDTEGTAGETATVPFWGEHQAGIGTHPQAHLYLAAFDVHLTRRQDLENVLHEWSLAASKLCLGQPLSASNPAAAAPADSGEVVGLGPARLSLTFGLGRSLFVDPEGGDRFGLRNSLPAPLVDLPEFATDALEPNQCGGDLLVQACADSPQVAFHAVRNLMRIGGDIVTLRWAVTGFRDAGSAANNTPRNLLGFKDGTNSINVADAGAMNDDVWVGSEGPAWMNGGTYLVFRRIRLRLEQWDRDSLRDQEARIGRQKLTGAPLGSTHEFDDIDLDAQSGGHRIVPADAHIRVARTPEGRPIPLLRRSYSFVGGVDGSGRLNAGTAFISYQRDPRRQFIPIQERLAAHDALNHYVSHVGSAVFACPPGAHRGGWIGAHLFRA